MHLKRDNIEIIINDEIYDSLENRYKNNLKSMKGSEFVFDYVHLLHYKCHKRNLNCGRSYKDSSNWIKKSNNKSHQ